jgi:hypothetical protein
MATHLNLPAGERARLIRYVDTAEMPKPGYAAVFDAAQNLLWIDRTIFAQLDVGQRSMVHKARCDVVFEQAEYA